MGPMQASREGYRNGSPCSFAEHFQRPSKRLEVLSDHLTLDVQRTPSRYNNWKSC